MIICDRNQDLSIIDFVEGAAILIDKPLGWTSFDVVNKIRFTLKYHYGVKKIKVGHAGTLDPLATGLLIVCTGKMTKRIDEIQGLFKSYSGVFTLGYSTPSYDAESEPDHEYAWQHVNRELIELKRKDFVGLIDQMPPIFSAIKRNGVPLYKLARRGEEVEIKSRQVEIQEFMLNADHLPKLKFEVQCSKGTYIRSLAHDFGHTLGSGAYLSALVREGIGEYRLSDAWNLQDFIRHFDS